jgi:hypothetical protein
LAALEVAYVDTTVRITENDCSVVVFAITPDKCHTVLNSEQRVNGASLTIDDFKYAMNQLWRQGVGSQKKHTSDDRGELVLASFGGTCYNCQGKGHISNQCLKKTGPSNVNLNAGGETECKFSGT